MGMPGQTIWLGPGWFNAEGIKIVANDGIIMVCARGRYDYSIDFASDDGQSRPHPGLAAITLEVEGEAG
jgi:hypothetical protein